MHSIPPQRPVNPKEKHQWGLVGRIAFSALFAVLALIVNLTSFGEQFRMFTYRLLQGQLQPPKRIPVIVIDISELAPDENGVTPRKQLRALLTALSNMEANSGPKVIGVDIDMSPEVKPNGNLDKFIDPEDPALFEFCKVAESGSNEPASKHMSVPTYLGVFRTQALSPDRWLGFPQFKDLGASLWLPEKQRVAVPSLYGDERQPDKPTKARTLSTALAETYKGPEQESSSIRRWLNSVVGYVFPLYSPEEITSRVRLNESLIDFSVVDRLERERVVLRRKAYDSPEELRDYLDLRKADISNRMVLLGDVAHAQYAEDTFPDPAHGQSIPGVLIHGAAAFTEAERPLHVIRGSIEPFVDFLIALACLTIQTSVIAWLGHRIRDERLELTVTVAFVLLILLFGILINLTHVLWDGFLFVAILTAIHPACERTFEHWRESFKKWLLRKPREAQ
jgi:CHASE2 domain-containing sensor protein